MFLMLFGTNRRCRRDAKERESCRTSMHQSIKNWEGTDHSTQTLMFESPYLILTGEYEDYKNV